MTPKNDFSPYTPHETCSCGIKLTIKTTYHLKKAFGSYQF